MKISEKMFIFPMKQRHEAILFYNIFNSSETGHIEIDRFLWNRESIVHAPHTRTTHTTVLKVKNEIALFCLSA